MSFVRSKKAACPPSKSRLRHESKVESSSPHHHHRHHDVVESGPGGARLRHEEEYHEVAPVPQQRIRMKLVNPHEEVNQARVCFNVDIISSAEMLESDPKEREKLEINIYDCIVKAVKNQKLMMHGPDGCVIAMDVANMKGFVSKVCISERQNTFPFRFAFRFPHTECGFIMRADGVSEGTFCINGDSTYCCDTKCVFEARHRDGTKKHISKYGGYNNPGDLWFGTAYYREDGFAHVPANCMGVAIVTANLRCKERPNGFDVDMTPAFKARGMAYYKWDMAIIEKVNATYSSDVLPTLEGSLFDFSGCECKYVIKAVRADAKPEGQPERSFISREGTPYADDSEGVQAFRKLARVRFDCELILGFTSKACMSIDQVCCP